jgi:CRP-like cAMP-binding protein
VNLGVSHFQAYKLLVRAQTLGALQGFSSTQLHVLSEKAHFIRVDLGQRVIKSGEASTFFFLVLSGSMQICSESKSADNLIKARDDEGIVRVGEMCGEMSYFERNPRSANCESREADTILMIITFELLDHIASEDQELGAKLINTMACICIERLQKSLSRVNLAEVVLPTACNLQQMRFLLRHAAHESGLLSTLDDSEVDLLAHRCAFAELAPDARLFSYGMEARFACIILQGTAVDKRKARDGAMQGWALFACLLVCLFVCACFLPTLRSTRCSVVPRAHASRLAKQSTRGAQPNAVWLN